MKRCTPGSISILLRLSFTRIRSSVTTLALAFELPLVAQIYLSPRVGRSKGYAEGAGSPLIVVLLITTMTVAPLHARHRSRQSERRHQESRIVVECWSYPVERKVPSTLDAERAGGQLSDGTWPSSHLSSDRLCRETREFGGLRVFAARFHSRVGQRVCCPCPRSASPAERGDQHP
jgi:hypothetical protein